MRRQGLSTYHIGRSRGHHRHRLAGVGLTGMLSEQIERGFSWGWTRSD